MATDMDDDEEDFVTIGSAFDVPEEPAATKKPSTVHEQIAVDEKGRRRFHGAFTGGFSAGYFNSVGTKEGWTPSTFVSSRANRQNKENAVQRPEDFMDEEDFGEYGIAPKKFMTKDNFTPQETENLSLKRSLDQAVKEGVLKSAVPGGLPVDDLIIASKSSKGIVLLRKMGWKEGQGVGDKVKSVGLASNASEAKKIYGCALPLSAPSSAGTKEVDIDMSNLRLYLAPKDVQPISFDAKNNTHGIGYSGIDPNKAMFFGAGSLAEAFKPSGTEKRGIRGQAFGVGAFEDEDDDIYMKDTMSNYDFSMASEAEIDRYANHGWSGPSKKDKQKGVLVGFQKASKPTAINKIFPAPSLPLNYIPHHSFSRSNSEMQVQKPSSRSSRNFLTADDRAVLLGEKEPKKAVESVFDVISDQDKSRMETLKEKFAKKPEHTDDSELGKGDGRIQPEKPRKVSRWDSKVKKTIAYVPSGAEGDSFKPFANDPEKQERYHEFLTTKQLGKKTEISYKSSNMTEWEKEREKEEFARASILFRPMSTTIASRFTRGTQDTDKKATDDDNTVNKTDTEKAASLGLFGKLTRKTHEWHPSSVLCKRFNIPDPYPGSRVTGIPGNERKKGGWMEDFDAGFGSDRPVEDDDKVNLSRTEVTRDNESSKDHSSQEPVEHKNTTETADEIAFPLKTPFQRKQQKSIKIGPLSYLNDIGEKPDKIEKPTPTNSAAVVDNSKEPDLETTKPSMDLFKAIFADSDDSSDEEQDASNSQSKSGKEDVDEVNVKGESPAKAPDSNTIDLKSHETTFDKAQTKSFETSMFDKVETKSYEISQPDTTKLASFETSEFENNGSGKISAAKETPSSAMKSSDKFHPDNAAAGDRLVFGPTLHEKSRLLRKDPKLMEPSRHEVEIEGTDRDFEEKSSKKHKKEKQKQKKHKQKQKSKKSKRKSEKKNKHSKYEDRDTNSTDSDQDSDAAIIIDSGSNHQIMKSSDQKSKRSKNYSKERSIELDSERNRLRKKKSKKRKSKHSRRSSSDDSEGLEADSSSKRTEDSKERSKKEDDTLSARALVEKMRKHGLVIKRKSAADFM